MNVPTKIIERIRALLNLASNNPSEAEAASAAARAAALMAEHHLAQAEIEAAGGEFEKEPIGASVLEEGKKNQTDTWKRVLLFGIKRLFAVELIAIGGNLAAFGKLSDVQTVQYTWAYLTREIENLAQRYWRNLEDQSEGKRTVLNDFRRGAASRLQARMLDMKAEQDASAARASASPGALLVINRDALAVQDAFAAHLKALGLRKSGPSKTRGRASAAAEAGAAAGDSMRLSGGQALGAEARRLGAAS